MRDEKRALATLGTISLKMLAGLEAHGSFRRAAEILDDISKGMGGAR